MKLLRLLPLILLAGCSVGSDYRRDRVDAASPAPPPADWKWKKADPSDRLPRGA